jgi:glycosyltransferase involved in cell wall biosynthesis
MYEEVRATGVSVYSLNPPGPWVHRIRALQRVFVEEAIDIAHGFTFPTYTLVAVAAARSGRPAVVAGVRSLGLELEHRWPFSWFERLGNRMTHRIVANAEAVKEALVRRDPVVRPKVSVIHNGIDVEAYRTPVDAAAFRTEMGMQDFEFMILMVANLIEYKGHHEMLQAYAEFRRRRPQARLVLAGTGPCESALRRKAHELGIAAHVSFLGRRSDVPRLLAAADVVVLASHQEGFPNAILEAMAAGKPVVATRVGGVPEQVEDGVTGYLTEPRDVAGMVHALERIAADPEGRLRMGAQARLRAADRFSWGVIVGQYQDLYTLVLGDAGRRAGSRG